MKFRGDPSTGNLEFKLTLPKARKLSIKISVDEGKISAKMTGRRGE
jgi:hypothetical protein